MANFSFIGTIDGSQPVKATYDVVAGTEQSCLVGDLVSLANGYAVKTANGGCSAAGIHGLVVKQSTETATAAGVVEVIWSHAGLILRGTPTTAANLAVGILFDRVTIDVSSATQTVDENDAAGGIVTILDYDATNSTIDVAVAATF